MVKVCHNLCERFKKEKIQRPMYEFQRRCTVCEVVLDIEKVICPCCSAITRGRPHKKQKINKETIRTDRDENRSICSKML